MPKIKDLPLDLQKALPLYFDQEADIDEAPSKDYADTPLKWSLKNSNRHWLSARLLEAGANPNATGKFDQTHPLQVFFSTILNSESKPSHYCFEREFMRYDGDNSLLPGRDADTDATLLLKLLMVKGVNLRINLKWTDKIKLPYALRFNPDTTPTSEFTGTVLDLTLYFTKFHGFSYEQARNFKSHTDLPSHLSRTINFDDNPRILKIICAAIQKQMSSSQSVDGKSMDEQHRLKLADFSASGLSEAEWLVVKNIGAMVVAETGEETKTNREAQSAAEGKEKADRSGPANSANAASGNQLTFEELVKMVRAQNDRIDSLNDRIGSLEAELKRLRETVNGLSASGSPSVVSAPPLRFNAAASGAGGAGSPRLSPKALAGTAAPAPAQAPNGQVAMPTAAAGAVVLAAASPGEGAASGSLGVRSSQ